ncbi:MAG: hypothetical protein RIA72_04960 [Sphingopyxis sp.]|uniref:hypothetical protein n=1 Tax=Sphingopyxis sp. TaxID=1908224 RepID=UPI0032ECCD1C
MRRAKMVGAVLALFVALSGTPAGAGEPLESEAAFSKLSALAGSWKRAGSDGIAFRIDFELTANDSVLVERWVHRDKTHSLTIYHRDGPTLMATHYCPQGNQPRLRMESGGDENRISFDFHDATNLNSSDQSHQHRLSFDLADMGQVIRGEAYRQGETSKESEMALVRIP